jgi:hypothetical protein
MKSALLCRYKSGIDEGNGGDKDDEESTRIFFSSRSDGCL